MTDAKPKVEGKRPARRPARSGAPARREFVSKVVGLETHTFDIGNAKYAAKYQKSVDAIANHTQKEYKGGPEIAKAIRDMSLPTIVIPAYPTPATAGDPIDPGEVFLWQQDVTEAKKRKALLEENKKSAYALVLGQCSTDLKSKIKGADAYTRADADQDVVQLLKIIVETTRLLNDYKVPARQQRVRDPGNDGVAFVQTGPKKPGANATTATDVDCWHCGKKGHYRSDCPELKIQEPNVGVQNLHIDDCAEEHALFSSEEDEGLAMAQKSGERGVRGILLKHHVYIDTCASYASTPYPELLKNIDKQRRGLVGHSNAGSCAMDTAGDLGAIKQMWLNEGGVATVVPLKVLEQIWPITYSSHGGMNPGKFVVRTDQGDIVVKNNGKGMPYLDLRELLK